MEEKHKFFGSLKKKKKERSKSKQDEPKIPVWIIGDNGVGKKNIINSVTSKPFKESSEHFENTEVDVTNLKVPDQDINLILLRVPEEELTTGSVDQTKQQAYYSRAVVVVYDVTNPQSYLNAKHDVELIQKNKIPGLDQTESVSIYLVGNKTDLATRKMVDFNAVKDFAEKNQIYCAQISAKTGHGVKQLLEKVVGDQLKNMPKKDLEQPSGKEGILSHLKKLLP